MSAGVHAKLHGTERYVGNEVNAADDMREYQKTKDTQLILNEHNKDDVNRVVAQYDDEDGTI